jgi:hypothetical protein
MKSFVGAAFAAVGAFMFAGMTVSAYAADVYTVQGLAIDATGVSPSEARDKALAQGRASAFTIVFRRLTSQSTWPSQPKLLPQALDEMVTSFQVDNERSSTTRYLANASFTFNASNLRNALSSNGVTFSESVARPALVLARTPGAPWSGDTAWAKGWGLAAQRGSLRPVVVPAGDALEVASLSALNPATADWDAVSALAQKYGAKQVWFATATRTAVGMDVQLVTLDEDGRKDRRQTVTATAGEQEPQLAARAAAIVRASAEETWKVQTSVDFGTQNSLDASVSFNGLRDWVSIRKGLKEIRLIQHVGVNEVQMRGAKLHLDYLGNVDQLQTALRQVSLTLSESAPGQWILARSGATQAPLAPQALPAPVPQAQ